MTFSGRDARRTRLLDFFFTDCAFPGRRCRSHHVSGATGPPGQAALGVTRTAVYGARVTGHPLGEQLTNVRAPGAMVPSAPPPAPWIWMREVASGLPPPVRRSRLTAPL